MQEKKEKRNGRERKRKKIGRKRYPHRRGARENERECF